MAAQNCLSLGKVNFYIYDLVDVMLYLEPDRCYEFLFSFNRESRSFLEHKYPTVNRAFENEGLALKKIRMSSSVPDETLKYLD